MNTQFLRTFSYASSLCLFSLFNSQQAKAQSPIYGNSTGSGSNFQLILGTPSSTATPYIHMIGSDNNDTNQAGSINLIAGANTRNLSGVAFSFVYRGPTGTDYKRAMQIFQDGKILMGGFPKPTTRTGYTLAVGGEVVAQSLYITNPTSWADFVFEPTYKIRTLPELESYLLLNKHLPSIPSAKEVEATGYSVTGMDSKLLQSIEELTLQLIKLNKEVELLKEKVGNEGLSK